MMYMLLQNAYYIKNKAILIYYYIPICYVANVYFFK